MDCKVSCHVFNTSSFHRGAEISFEISSSSLALPSTQLKLWSSLTSPNKFHQIQTLGTEIQEITFPKCRNCQRQILFPSTFPLSFPFISFISNETLHPLCEIPELLHPGLQQLVVCMECKHGIDPGRYTVEFNG